MSALVGVEAPRNVVLVSMPSLVDPSLAPTGKHVIHAYTPATEPYENWANLDRKSDEYKAKKAEAAAFLWDAVEKYIPDARLRSDKRVEQIGTPLTHERSVSYCIYCLYNIYHITYIICLMLFHMRIHAPICMQVFKAR